MTRDYKTITTPDIFKPICSRCMQHAITFHSQHRDMCTECGDNYELVEKLRIGLSPYNYPNTQEFKEFLVNGERRVICPLCGSRANIYGFAAITLHCKFCATYFYKLNSGIVLVRKNRGERDIPYLTNDHIPLAERFDNETKIEISAKTENTVEDVAANRERLSKLLDL